ncbi:MAG: hypothetical protein JW779_13145 [Candidatus Thorarchaeota archaeon]|nr:hypothetical protein [Candidatus Thorarchaeota archaeon]
MEDTPDERNLDLKRDLAICIIHGAVLFLISYAFYFYWNAVQNYQYIVMHPMPPVILPELPIHFAILILIGFAIVVVSSGVLNAIAIKRLWSIKANSNSRIWLAEGLMIQFFAQILFFPFPLIQSVIAGRELWVQILFPSLIILDYWILLGFIGKSIGGFYAEPPPQLPKDFEIAHPAPKIGTRAKCPHCGSSFRYQSNERSFDGTVKCYACKRPFYMEPIEVLLEKLGEDTDMKSWIDL